MSKPLALMALLCWAAGVAAPALAAEKIIAAEYAQPVERYGHFALGKPHEYARVTATTDAGQRFSFDLPDDEVFEDLAPRLVTLSAGQAPQLLTIVSQRGRGARLMLIGLNQDRLEMSAQSPAIGTPMRWLNPIGVADLDGDGQAEIAAVITPHIAGTLKVYQQLGKVLREISALEGFSNHVFGSTELALASAHTSQAGTRLLVPDATRSVLRIISLQNGRLVERGRCPQASPIVGPIKQISATQVSLGLAAGRATVELANCSSRSATGH